jgi:hypothetical protein
VLHGWMFGRQGAPRGLRIWHRSLLVHYHCISVEEDLCPTGFSRKDRVKKTAVHGENVGKTESLESILVRHFPDLDDVVVTSNPFLNGWTCTGIIKCFHCTNKIQSNGGLLASAFTLHTRPAVVPGTVFDTCSSLLEETCLPVFFLLPPAFNSLK